MGTTTAQSEQPSNLDLIKEAGETADCQRQSELAEHPSYLVRRALAKNRALCLGAAEILGDELASLRSDTNVHIGVLLTD